MTSKYYWQISTFLMLLSALVVGWMCFEIGLLDNQPLYAGEEAIAPSDDNLKQIQKQQRELSFREREVADRESVIKEHLIRTEKAIVDLKEKLVRKDDEMKKALLDKDAAWKKKFDAQEAELKRVRAEMKKVKDTRAESYKNIYEQMDPKRAAKILDELDINLAAQILGDMKQEQAAQILGKMSPERARVITEKPLKARNLASSEQEKKVSPEHTPEGGEQ
jgi:flagellar motility protein MotE (MotC chaperone)